MRSNKGTASQPPRTLAGVTHFASAVEGAAAVLNTALAPQHQGVTVPEVTEVKAAEFWPKTLLHQSAQRAKHVIAALDAYPASAPPEAAFAAFGLLSALTSAEDDLHKLHLHDPKKALRTLDEMLVHYGKDLITQTALAEMVESLAPAADVSFEKDAAQLLKASGGAYSLTEAAGKLDISRQALHKRLSKGTALGMMLKGEIAVPKLQFTPNNPAKIIAGVDRVTSLFKAAHAGAWATLQFLTEHDPNLNTSPIAALRSGRVAEVEQAAKAYLNLDED